MQASIVLTVAQGKRLIAKAVAQLPQVQRALADGIVAIGRGTTNAYVAEEILRTTLQKGDYVAGRTTPANVPGESIGTGKNIPDIVIKHGQRVEGATVVGSVEEMGVGDVFIKGGNALNYEQQLVGVLMGHPMGGTIGSTYGALVARKTQIVIPIGLEKLVFEDINALSDASRLGQAHLNSPVVSLFPFTGLIVTEIEALDILCDVEARLLSAGGVAGAEGALWLLLDGEEAAIDRALALYEELKSEPNIQIL
ncbi:MAG: hypothetical protein ACYDBB_20170 [Armatimonadota bacterium]